MPQQTVYVKEEDMTKWRELTAQKKGASRLSFAINMTDEEVELVEKTRADRDKTIKLPANHD